MIRNVSCGLLAVICLLLATATVFAHHSVAGEFDVNKPIQFTGTVKLIEWTNPHGWTQVEVKNADGTVSIYRVEIGAPISLYRQGWRKDSVKPGAVVNFKGIRAKNVNSRNVNGALTLPDGTRLWSGDGPAGAQAGAQ